jgi:hypothetical protein
MDKVFTEHVASLRPKLERLLAMQPLRACDVPRDAPKAGVYVLSENGRDLYVGRSNGIRGRIGRHCNANSGDKMAAFAFRLARGATGNTKATYKKGAGSRRDLMLDPAFCDAFDAAKARIRAMELRYVEEADPVRQTLLEIYVAVVLSTPYNDFDNH